MSSFDFQFRQVPKAAQPKGPRVRVKSDFSGGFIGRCGTLLGIDVCQPEGSRNHLVQLDGMHGGTFWSSTELEPAP